MTVVRPQIAGARRVVVKVGSSSLTTLPGGLDAERLSALVDVLGGVRAAGREVVLVSSGAIAAGLAPLSLSGRPRDLATAQAAASVGQLRLVQTYADAFAAHGVTVGQVLLTADDLTRGSHSRNAARTIERLLALGALPIVNENDTVATEEIRFGDNDRLAALVAHVAQGAAPVVAPSPPQAAAALAGERVGTLFNPMGRRPSARQFWLRYASRPRGRVLLDEGAVRALRERHASLLADRKSVV